jgi:protein-S-isoprenylcysteine O-methyltransferase Ste14
MAGLRWEGIRDNMSYTTRRMRPINLINVIWTSLVLVWAAGSFKTKRAARTESRVSRGIELAFVLSAYALLFSSYASVGPLAIRFVPVSLTIEYVGVAIAFFGAAVAIWARLLLGRNWSAAVTIKENHELIRRGPYAFVRHPIYSGLLLAFAGTAITVGEVRGLVAVILAFIGWRMKSRVEEAFMMAQFGAEYEKYSNEVKALVPFVL